MYIEKIDFTAFKSFLKNPTDFFLEGSICIPDDTTKYFRFIRTPAAKGEHTVELLYGGEQYTDHLTYHMGNKPLLACVSLDFMAYVVDGETFYSAREALHELFPNIKMDTMNEQLLDDATKELEAYLNKTVYIAPHELLDPRYQSKAYETAVKEYVLGSSVDGIVFYNFCNLLLRSDDTVKVDFLANPTGFGERYASLLYDFAAKDPLLFDAGTAKSILCIQRRAKQYIKEFEAHPDGFESQCKALMKALDDCDTVRITIKVNGQTKQINYPAHLLQNYKTFSRKGLSARDVCSRCYRNKVEEFLTKNYKDYDHQVIPLKLIPNIQNGKDIVWTNPYFEEV